MDGWAANHVPRTTNRYFRGPRGTGVTGGWDRDGSPVRGRKKPKVSGSSNLSTPSPHDIAKNARPLNSAFHPCFHSFVPRL